MSRNAVEILASQGVGLKANKLQEVNNIASMYNYAPIKAALCFGFLSRKDYVVFLNRIKKNDFRHLTQSFSQAVYLSLAMTRVALAPVAKFHSLDDISIPASL